MPVPNLDNQSIEAALKYIDENGVPDTRTSTKYFLISDEGKQYPPKYVISVADHIANGGDFDHTGFNAVEAVNYLKKMGYIVESKQEKFELTITAESAKSTDDSFTMDDLGRLGDKCKPLDISFIKADGTVIKRNYAKGERKNSNQTMPRLAFQLFESQIIAMSVEQKEDFPVCKYTPESEIIRGIFTSVEEFRTHRNTIEYLIYKYGNGRQFVIYCWNIFSTIVFVQECLKRFGEPGDSFKLVYREKDEKEEQEELQEQEVAEQEKRQFNGYLNKYSNMLIDSKNIIFRGAPGTGKTYLAKSIAADIISDGYFDEYTSLTDEQKTQVEFVQFHPSYDYSDFVEGLRPRTNEDGTMGFELQDGVFKRFVDKARKNYENSLKTTETIAAEISAQEAINEFFSDIEFGVDTFETISGNKFTVSDLDDNHIYVSIPDNAMVKTLTLNLGEIKQMLESGISFKKVKDITNFFGKTFATQGYSYNFVLYNEILKKKKKLSSKVVRQEELKKYVFIIDEINRGEISKIFGELFFAVDPGYRGKAGEVSTQYANLHSNPNEKFYIPDNVYIIGTMNDIDRSVDSFDFAMRRRFRFIEIKADEQLEMLDSLGEDLKTEAIARMDSLNKEIAKTEGLNENYQIGGSYFLKLKTVNFDQLWADYIKPLLQEYVNGMYDEEGIMEKFKKAYENVTEEDVDESN